VDDGDPVYNDAFYAELGRLVVGWSRVEYLLKVLLARLTGADEGVAYLLTADMTTGRVIERCKWLVENSLDGDERLRVLEWLQAAKSGLEARNAMLHGGWAAMKTAEGWVPTRVAVTVKRGKVEHRRDVTGIAEVQAVREQVAGVLRQTDDLRDLLGLSDSSV
jgi:hypothetical protein